MAGHPVHRPAQEDPVAVEVHLEGATRVVHGDRARPTRPQLRAAAAAAALPVPQAWVSPTPRSNTRSSRRRARAERR